MLFYGGDLMGLFDRIHKKEVVKPVKKEEKKEEEKPSPEIKKTTAH
ncbi:MAG: hypothetical protein PWQ47_693 [Methanothermococcus sp.]|nr:hypothetical protein [Methanothermococcus sp.]